MTLLEKCVKSFGLWTLKLTYRAMTKVERLEVRVYCLERIQEQLLTKSEGDYKLAEFWQEFYNWTDTYEPSNGDVLLQSLNIYVSNFYELILKLRNLLISWVIKFSYLYLMNSDKKTQYRRFISSRTRELVATNDPNLELSIKEYSELYQWMCENG